MVSDWRILVVGCGGTGGFVAEGLCRLLIGTKVPLVLIDHDRVEEHNLLRQNFYPGEIGEFKSQALAERLARQYGRPIKYSVYPFDNEMVGHEFGGGMVNRMAQGIIIGCVDNAEARRSIARGYNYGNWWLDAGNGQASGQVLIGNARRLEEMGSAFDEASHQVTALPLPSIQAPALLVPAPRLARRDCAQAVDDGQSPVINQAMAMLVLQFMDRLLSGKLSWMGAYIDLEAGTLQAVPAEPETVARNVRGEGRHPHGKPVRRRRPVLIMKEVNMEVQKQPEGAVEAAEEEAEEVTEEETEEATQAEAPQAQEAAAPQTAAKAPKPAEMKVVILINGENVLLGVGMTDCDPIFKNLKSDLAAALAQVPEFVADAKQKWAVNPRYSKAVMPEPPASSTTAAPARTPVAPEAPKAQPSFF